MKRTSLRRRAIRGAWAVARHYGLCGKAGRLDGLMDRDADVRMAVVAAWEAGYRCGMKARAEK